jgi:hypothetical protein
VDVGFEAEFSTSATSSPERCCRYSATVFGSNRPGRVAGGVVRRRRGVTWRMRATSSWAASLSATFWPICLISLGSRVSSR